MSELPQPPAQPALPVTFRPERTRVILLTAGLAIFVVVAAVALLLDMGPGERLSFIVTGALMAWVLARLARVKVVAEQSGVTVVNIAGSRRLAWAEIVAVNLRPGDPWVFLDLSDGTSLAALGIQPGVAKQRAIADARTLRTLVEQQAPRDPELPRT
ncbi:PH domain-containing protein [Streptomyces sp. NPDC048202]|uniref:PH domain-containing protein n=1 Tax=Streptomyces sp. NPDC048202 TaxID=3365514 RepID=UPI00371AF831